MWSAPAALDDIGGLKERVDFNNCEIEFIENELKDIPGLIIFHSTANYILFDGTDSGKLGNDLARFAKSKEMIFRLQPNLDDRNGWVRITLSCKEENRMAVNVIKDFYS